MRTSVISRKQTSFRLSEDLIARLQEEARKHNRSLNNLVESVLIAFLADKRDVPNDITLAAMKEAETADNLETLDLGTFRNFVASL